MTKSILKLSLLSLLAVALTGMPAQLRAEDTVKPPAEKKGQAKKSQVMPFHGKLKAVDNTAKTIAVGEMTIQVTSETIISKDGKPAMLADGVVGEIVSGACRKTDDGKLNALKVTFGKKAEAKDTARHEKKTL